jgi:hypothetical protein
MGAREWVIAGCLAVAVLIGAAVGVDIYRTKQARPAAPAPAAGDRHRLFRERTLDFLTEARAGAKLLSLHPSVSEAVAKSQRVTDLYARIPEPPKGFDPHGTFGLLLRDIQSNFELAVVGVKIRDEAERREVPDAARGAQKTYEDHARLLRKWADQAEAKLATLK